MPTLGAQRAVPAAGYHPCLLRRVSRRAECMHFASPASCWVLGTRVAALLLPTLVSGFEGSARVGVPRPWPGLPVVPGPALCRCGAVGQGGGNLGVRGKRLGRSWERGGTSWPPVALPSSHVYHGERHHCSPPLSGAVVTIMHCCSNKKMYVPFTY